MNKNIRVFYIAMCIVMTIPILLINGCDKREPIKTSSSINTMASFSSTPASYISESIVTANSSLGLSSNNPSSRKAQY